MSESKEQSELNEVKREWTGYLVPTEDGALSFFIQTELPSGVIEDTIITQFRPAIDSKTYQRLEKLDPKTEYKMRYFYSKDEISGGEHLTNVEFTNPNDKDFEPVTIEVTDNKPTYIQ